MRRAPRPFVLRSRRPWETLLLAAISLSVVPALSSDEASSEAILIRASRLYPVASEAIENGMLLVRDGLIVEVGQHISAPEGARTIDVQGSVVPGLIDCGSTIAVRGRAAEEFVELTPEIRLADSLDLDQARLRQAFFAGVTTVGIEPGDRNVIGGIGAVVRTLPVSLREALIGDVGFLAISLSESTTVNNRTLRSSEPYSLFHRIPTTRMGTVFLVRRAFFEAFETPLSESLLIPGEEHMTKLLTPEGEEVLRQSARGNGSIRFQVEQKQEILAAFRIIDEFGLSSAVLEGVVEGVDLIPELSRRKLDVLIRPGGYVGTLSDENPNRVHDLAKRLDEAGIRFGFSSDSPSAVSLLRDRVAFDLRFGLSEKRALRALTLDAAAILGISDLLGSIEAGKRADLVAFSSDPFATTSRVLWVMSGGKIFRDETVFPQ